MHKGGEENKNAYKMIKITLSFIKVLAGPPKVAWGSAEHSLYTPGIVTKLCAGRPRNLHSISDSA